LGKNLILVEMGLTSASKKSKSNFIDKEIENCGGAGRGRDILLRIKL